MAVESPTTIPYGRVAETPVTTRTLALVASSAIIAVALSVIPVNSGDAAVYFTYFKQFFTSPFSYAPGHVSFGATSPLWVVLNAPIAWIFGSSFMTPSHILAGALLLGGASCLAATVTRSNWSLPLVAALVALNVPLVLATGELFETGLAFALVALVYFAMRTDRTVLATMGAGLLPLARPETAPMALFVYFWVMLHSSSRIRTGMLILASLSPVLIYYGYMFVQTGGVIPSSASARILEINEARGGWWRDLLESFGQTAWSRMDNIIYPLGAIACLAAIMRFGIRAMRLELALLTMLLVPFIVQPPLGLAPRYLEISSPILTVIVAQVILSMPRRSIVLPTITIGTLLLAGYLLYPYIGLARFSYNRLLLRDLANKLNPMLHRGEKVLLFEIQGQYYLLGDAVSADGIVGGAVLPVLRGQLSWDSFIKRENIDYIVTMDAFDYRRIYGGTLLARLYAYDLDHPIGATMRSDGLAFTKVLTNPNFADPSKYEIAAEPGLNVGDSIRVYAGAERATSGAVILWNSVYRVTGLR
jgi:hypothetical protein